MLLVKLQIQTPFNKICQPGSPTVLKLCYISGHLSALVTLSPGGSKFLPVLLGTLTALSCPDLCLTTVLEWKSTDGRFPQL